MSEMCVGRLPNRKGIYLWYADGSTITVIAKFINEAAANLFMELSERGLQAASGGGDEPA